MPCASGWALMRGPEPGQSRIPGKGSICQRFYYLGNSKVYRLANGLLRKMTQIKWRAVCEDRVHIVKQAQREQFSETTFICLLSFFILFFSHPQQVIFYYELYRLYKRVKRWMHNIKTNAKTDAHVPTLRD